jgi:hypothetical protein
MAEEADEVQLASCCDVNLATTGFSSVFGSKDPLLSSLNRLLVAVGLNVPAGGNAPIVPDVQILSLCKRSD